MPFFDCKQLSELSSSSIFHLPNIWVVFKGLNYIKVVFLKKKSHFVSRGTLRYRSVSSFAETVAMLLSEFIWNRQVVEEIMQRRAVHQILLSCLGYICIWWLEFLKLKKKNKRLNSASYAYFNVPFPISQIIYFHHQCTGWFSHPFPMFQSYQGSIATLIFCAKFLKTYTPFLFWNST